LRFLTAAVLLFAGSPAVAQLRPYVAIEKAQVGFDPGLYVNEQGEGQRSVPVAKKGQWAPVSFELKVIRKLDPAAQLPMKLRVDGRDADGTRYTAYFPLGRPLNGFTPPPTDPTGTDTTAPVNTIITPADLPQRACARPGGDDGSISLTVMSDVPGERADDISDTVKVDGIQLRDPSVYVVLSLGSKLSGFDLKDSNGIVRPDPSNRGGLRNGRVESAVINSVAEMPDRWFAYEAADLVVIPTGDSRQGFLEELFDPQRSQPYARKREALLEWVRRGGKLVVSVGRNANTLTQYPAFTDLLPVALAGQGNKEVTALEFPYTRGAGTATTTVELTYSVVDPMTKRPKRDQPFWVATLAPKTPGRTPLAVARDKDQGLVVAQTPLGLGRVTVVAFDLDAVPFTALSRPTRQDLWDWLIRVAGSDRAAIPPAADRDRPNSSSGLSPVDVEDGAVAAIRRHVDHFEGVPVISFGWVALFIFLYTLVIGPVEYLFLKKIVGRLELTWVTFPIIVLSVSAAAYFTAYYIKGKDLRINKIDVVDIDLGTQRVYGRTWFTVFSPRVDSYTVGIEPKAPWAPEPKYGTPIPPSMVDWVGGIRTAGTGGFRSYRYDLDGTGTAPSGLVSVPIQVWSTKAFVADWSADFDPAAPPVTADLSHPPADAATAAGTITANLPLGNLQEGFLFYAGEAYKLDALPAGVAVPFSSTKQAESNWQDKVTLYDGKFQSDDMYDVVGGRRKSRTAGGVSAEGPLSLWGVLLGDRAARHANQMSQNASLRTLDQSWRLNRDNTEEVMILVKLARAVGPAEELMTDPASTSPSQLWLRGLPGLDEQGNRKTRTPVPGILQQETYVRIFIPVKPAGGAK
jgi:hypothetical protein